MSKQSWNAFIKSHSSRATFLSVVSAALSPAIQFDKNKQKLPTPYGLFIEWAQNSLAGDWSATKVPGGFLVSVAEEQDAIKIKNAFGIIGDPVKTPASNKTRRIGYSDMKYGRLAKALGYAV